jgi:hypothetical protein
VDVDVQLDAVGSDLLVEYGEMVITGIDAEMTALLFLHPAPVVVPTGPVTPWPRHNGRRMVRSRRRRHAPAPSHTDVPFDPLPSSAWKLVDDLERLLARYATEPNEPDTPIRVIERVGA